MPLNIAIVGAGPAGLYLAYLLKRRRPETHIRVFEQNARDTTFGFGVVFSDRALEFLRDDDPHTYEAIAPKMESWSDIELRHPAGSVRIDGIGFSAIGRLELLGLLRARLDAVGVVPEYDRRVASLAELKNADLIVGADGVNSLVREAHAPDFGASVAFLTNKFAWYGTTRRFETLTQTFVRTDHGVYNAHHYRYSPTMSTFIVETDEATFELAGLARMNAGDTKSHLERVFAVALDGHGLVENRSMWRSFPKVRNQRWYVGNCVLLGDALRTLHFSIGSGTRLALEDAIALANALHAHSRDLPAALAAYERVRRPIAEKLIAAADASADWYERFGENMELAPLDFAMSYLTRSGRIDPVRLRQLSPRFMAAYEAR